MSQSLPIKVLMDVDTGVDDAMALAFATMSPAINLVGVTTVAGNVPIERATRNTLDVLDFLGKSDIPVYRGMSAPLVRNHFDAAHFHGHDGLAGADFGSSSRVEEPMTAPEFIVSTARAFAEDLTLVFVGPLTNLAVALALEPDLPKLVSKTVVMGGAFDRPGNATPFAEFNIAVDPEAANLVAESELKVTWIGLDVTHSADLYRADWDLLVTAKAPAAQLVREVCRYSLEHRGQPSVHLHDPLAVGAAIDASIVETVSSAVLVDISVRDTAGATRMVKSSQLPAHDVALGVDRIRFRRMFGDAVGIEMVE